MAKRLTGKNAVITGAGRGIGRAVALALAEEGANVVVCDIGGATDGSGTDRTPADEVVSECKKFGVKAVAQYGNVASFKDAEDMILAAIKNFGRIDIVCNIAGIDKPKMLANMTEQEWDQVIAVHLKGSFNLTRHALPWMKAQQFGRIINCVSEAYAGGATHVNYAAAKGGIASLTYGTAREMGKYGVTCNSFVPRARTRMTMDEKVTEGIKKRVEQGLLTQAKFDEMMKGNAPPEIFAPFMAYLCSDAAANINGCLFLTTGNEIGLWNHPAVIKELKRTDWEVEGKWSIDMLEKEVPAKLMKEYVNPAPAGKRKPTFEDIKAMEGKKKEETIEVDKTLINGLCQALEDSSPKWKDQAPPSLVTAAMLSGGIVALAVPQPYVKNVAAGADWEYYKPIKLGDKITTVHEFAELQNLTNEKGPRALMVFTSKHTNQNGELVAKSTNTIMSYA